MATEVKTVCDGCGKQKQAVNHWWQAKSAHRGYWILPFGESDETGFQDFCGQECLLKAVSEWMQKGKG